MQSFYVVRNIFLAVCLCLGLASLGLIAHWTQATSAIGYILDFEILCIVVGGLTALLFPVLIAICEFRKNAYMSYVVVELPLLLVFWILWLVTGVLVENYTSTHYPEGCISFVLTADQMEYCNEIFATQKISMAVFALLLIYWVALLVVSCAHHVQGNPIWMTSVKDIPLFTTSAEASAPANLNLNLQQVEDGKAAISPYTPQTMSITPITTPALSTPTSMPATLPFTPAMLTQTTPALPQPQ